MKKIIISISIIVLLLAFPLYQLYALNNVEMQSLQFSGISLDNRLHLVVSGSGNVYNPAIIPVTVKKIEYTVYFENEEIMNGTIAGKKIPAHTAESFPFEQTIDWVPDVDTALKITSGKNVTATIFVNADVSYLYFFTITGKKQQDIEIGKILKPVIQKQIAAVSDAIGLFL